MDTFFELGVKLAFLQAGFKEAGVIQIPEYLERVLMAGLPKFLPKARMTAQQAAAQARKTFQAQGGVLQRAI
jgi:hypothetical protein